MSVVCLLREGYFAHLGHINDGLCVVCVAENYDGVRSSYHLHMPSKFDLQDEEDFLCRNTVKDS